MSINEDQWGILCANSVVLISSLRSRQFAKEEKIGGIKMRIVYQFHCEAPPHHENRHICVAPRRLPRPTFNLLLGSTAVRRVETESGDIKNDNSILIPM